ncbi:MAG: C1 family peptidase, partial [Bacteroidota bacterium]|nr:C1 family peptidase [Bacteroidota bacterium]
HNELEAFLNGGLKGIIANKPRIISPAWKAGFNGVLDAYMGKKPEQFTYNGKSYSPKSFAAELGINPDDYIELTSYSHHPYYRPFPLEVQDNWSNDLYYNLPIKELIEVINNAIDNGYSVCWDGDVSEREFLHQSGIATLTKPESLSFDDYRQSTFNNWSTTDDHLMHIVGKAIDKNGKAYYYTKNSWGSESNKLGGFLYMSEDYLQVKTIAILVNKKSIPSSINEKLFGKQ